MTAANGAVPGFMCKVRNEGSKDSVIGLTSLYNVDDLLCHNI